MSSRGSSPLPAVVAVALLLGAVPWGVAGGATITVVNMNDPNEGFNDPTPVAAVPGNAGTTLGQQRLNAFQAAAAVWGVIVESGVEVLVEAEMVPLPCDATSAILGAAGPNSVHRDFANAPRSATWYPAALANSLAGFDLNSAFADVGAGFNSDVDTDPDCLMGVTWFYGIDSPAPAGTVDFFNTVLHEIAHGLGFTSFVDRETGAKLSGFDDIYMTNLEDHSTGELWPDMTNGERAASAIDTGDLHWVGASAVSRSGLFSAGVHPGGHVQMYAPNPLEGGSSVAHWDTALTPNELMEPNITPDLADIITTNLLEDIGWELDGGGGDPTCPNGAFTVSDNGTVCAERAFFCGLPAAAQRQAEVKATSACSGGIVYDDGSFNFGLTLTSTEAHFVQRYNQSDPMALVEQVCVCWVRGGFDSSINFDVEVYDGSGGQPGSLLGSVSATASGIPGFPGAFFDVDMSSAGIVVPAGSYYIGVSYNGAANEDVFVCYETSGTQRSAFASTGGPWVSLPVLLPTFRAFGIRTEFEEVTPDPGCFNTGQGADLAERIDVTGDVMPGDLVEIDPRRPGYYRRSQGPYSTLVGGVAASAPGITLANRTAGGVPLDSRPLLALMGRLPVRATAENGPIRPGDLLVSSSTPGAVMRCGEPAACAGTVVGKALEALPAGSGKIEMLLVP